MQALYRKKGARDYASILSCAPGMGATCWWKYGVASITKFINERLQLVVNKQKGAVGYPAKRKVLGFSFTFCQQVKLRIAWKAKKGLKRKFADLQAAVGGIKERLEKFNVYLLGWSGYLWYCSNKECISGARRMDTSKPWRRIVRLRL